MEEEMGTGKEIRSPSRAGGLIMENTMRFAGTIDSEETMWGQLPNGKHVYVHMLTAYEHAPEALRDDPEYWQHRIENGDFEDPENYPIAWIK